LQYEYEVRVLSYARGELAPRARTRTGSTPPQNGY